MASGTWTHPNHFIVALVLLVLSSVACSGANIYTRFVTSTDAPRECAANKYCVPQDMCIDGTIDDAGGYRVQTALRSDLACPSNEVCCGRSSEENNDDNPNAQIAKGCGYRNERGVAKKSRGNSEEAEFGEFPWMLAVIINDVNKKYLGGASLLHPKVALTAAHVVNGKSSKLVVRAGEWIPKEDTEELPHQDRAVSEIVVHEEYRRPTLHNDIALLFLQTQFELRPHINTICLPPMNSIINENSCFVTGWGELANSAHPDVLKKIGLNVVKNPACQEKLRTTALSRYFRLHESFMCAGGTESGDACLGDGGSPLVCPIPGKIGRYYQVGAVSWGISAECRNDPGDIPGAYVNILLFRPWLVRKMAQRRIDSKSYTAD